jgi:hypothetical protein
MKLRIQDSSIRFRITLKELETLRREARVERACLLPGGAVFCYAVIVDATLDESTVALQPYAVELRLCRADFETLVHPAKEGVYIHREWTGNGEQKRFMTFIEKDRPGSTCVKKEAWIYEGHHGTEDSIVPIPETGA